MICNPICTKSFRRFLVRRPFHDVGFARELHAVAVPQLPAAAGFHASVDQNLARLDRLLGVPAGGHGPGQFQELVQANRLGVAIAQFAILYAGSFSATARMNSDWPVRSVQLATIVAPCFVASSRSPKELPFSLIARRTDFRKKLGREIWSSERT